MTMYFKKNYVSMVKAEVFDGSQEMCDRYPIRYYPRNDYIGEQQVLTVPHYGGDISDYYENIWKGEVLVTYETGEVDHIMPDRFKRAYREVKSTSVDEAISLATNIKANLQKLKTGDYIVEMGQIRQLFKSQSMKMKDREFWELFSLIREQWFIKVYPTSDIVCETMYTDEEHKRIMTFSYNGSLDQWCYFDSRLAHKDQTMLCHLLKVHIDTDNNSRGIRTSKLNVRLFPLEDEISSNEKLRKY